MNMLGHAYIFVITNGAWVGGNDRSKALGFVVLTYFPGVFLSLRGPQSAPPPQRS